MHRWSVVDKLAVIESLFWWMERILVAVAAAEMWSMKRDYGPSSGTKRKKFYCRFQSKRNDCQWPKSTITQRLKQFQGVYIVCAYLELSFSQNLVKQASWLRNYIFYDVVFPALETS